MSVLSSKRRTLLIRYSLFISVILIHPGFVQPELKLLSPASGKVIPNNAPALTWATVPCKYYEIWMDGRKIDSVGSSLNSCVPFPLSFGQHTWQVVAVDGDRKISSEKGSFTIDDGPLEPLPPDAVLLRNNWMIQSSLLVKEKGDALSGASANTKGWFPSTLPVTVLSALVRNGVYPNPYVGLNNMRIPDSNDEYNKEYGLLKYSHINGTNPWKDPYWFRTTFEVPADYKGKNIWLNFSEINYRAEVWLNGRQIADTLEMTGMERKFRFNISETIKSGDQNYLAVAIYPVDNPGRPAKEPITPLGAPGDNMGDGLISKNYTKWDAIGWDWQPAIRDREMGITEDVYLSATGVLEFDNLYVTADLPLPDTTSAKVVISGDIINHSGIAQKGILKGEISIGGKVIRIEQPFRADPYQSFAFLWDAGTFPQLNLRNPELWWPHGYGKPNLYALQIEAFAGKERLAETQTAFGIREVETYIGARERVYKINGKEIYCKGGNWVIDMMLNWNAKRYEDEILLTRNANLNILRVWGPTGVPPQVFYDAADQYGILIWQDFLYDFWGTYRNRPGYNTRGDLYETATIGIVKEYRNHPSLVIWCGGNEGPNPREALILNKILPQYDGRDTKHYLKISNGDGLHGGGPYHTLNPKDYFTHNRLNGFSSEIGPSGVPVLESVHKFMPELGRNWLEGRFPIDATWAYHDANDWAGNDSRKFSSYDNIIRQQYGAPESASEAGVMEYFKKTQLLNYDVYRASIEAINRQLWTNSSGILLWKSNSSWPSMVWQVYDWYLQAHAGYYGAKSAGEPVHIQFNRDSLDIVVLNALHKPMPDAALSAGLYNTRMEKLWQQSDHVTLKENSLYKTGWIVPVKDELAFLRLTVKTVSGATVSDNIYWINKGYDFRDLDQLQNARLSGKVTRMESGGRTKYRLHLNNIGEGIAFMIECRLQGAESGKELLPSLWNKNYVTLFPNESIDLEVDINNLDLTETPVVRCKAYNMEGEIVVR